MAPDSRFKKALLLGGLFAFAMFWTMQVLISGGDREPIPVTDRVGIDFWRTIKPTPVEPKRPKAQPKVPPKAPPLPKVPMDQARPDQQPLPFNLPPLPGG